MTSDASTGSGSSWTGAHILPAAFGIPAESEPLAEVAQLLSGAQPLESFVRLIEEELARAR